MTIKDFLKRVFNYRFPKLSIVSILISSFIVAGFNATITILMWYESKQLGVELSNDIVYLFFLVTCITSQIGLMIRCAFEKWLSKSKKTKPIIVSVLYLLACTMLCLVAQELYLICTEMQISFRTMIWGNVLFTADLMFCVRISLEISETITGNKNDDTMNFLIRNGVLEQYLGNSSVVVIPNTVTCIGKMAFASCDEITSVIIPNTVTEILEYAFYDCSMLTDVTIPDSVNKIDDNAFCDCKKLINVTMSELVTGISSSAFNGCVALKKYWLEHNRCLGCGGSKYMKFAGANNNSDYIGCKRCGLRNEKLEKQYGIRS